MKNKEKDQIVTVWEVYERDSQNSVTYLREEDARNSTFFDEVDIIAEVKIRVSPEAYKILLENKPLI